MRNILKIVVVILGAFIGAGFASGKEIYTFFYSFGYKGIIGIVVSCILLTIVVYKTLLIVNKNNIYNYKEFLGHLVQKNIDSKYYIGNIINNVVNILILISFFIMVAGFGAYFEQEYNINSIIGSIVLAIFSYLILKKDTNGLVKVNEILVPIIIIVIVLIGIVYIVPNKEINVETQKVKEYDFLVNSILYCSYNCIMLIPILTTVKNYTKNRKDIMCISVISGIIIVLLLLVMFFILNSNSINLASVEMPVAYILKNNVILKNLYGVIVLISIFTTAISLGSSFIKNVSKNQKSYSHIAKIMCITSIAMSQIGFSNLVNLLYPIFGYMGILQIIKLFKIKL